MSDTSAKKTCPACGESIMAVAKKCRFCGEYFDEELRQANMASMPSSAGVERMLVPIGRPASAIASGYLALFGIIPMFGLPFSIGAVITGIVALNSIKKNPKLSGSVRAWFGIVLGSLGTLVSIIGLIAVMAASAGHR